MAYPLVPVIVRQSSLVPLNTLGLGSLPSNHEGVVPDPLMCATLHAPVESSLDELWAADEAAAVAVPAPYAHHRSPSIGFTGYDVNTLPSFTRALAPGGSVAATPTIQRQGGALNAECKEGHRHKRLCTNLISLNNALREHAAPTMPLSADQHCEVVSRYLDPAFYQEALPAPSLFSGGLPVPLTARPEHQLCWVWLMLHCTTPLTRLQGALTKAPELAHHL